LKGHIDQPLESLRARFLPEAATADDMSYIDENSTALGIPVQSLMENAGAGVATAVEQESGPVQGKRVIVVAGTGNKGGDGFVAARHLLNRGAQVSVVLLGGTDEIRTVEARSNWQVLERLDVGVDLSSVEDSSDLGLLEDELSRSDVVVDAMLGTGLRGDLREPFASSARMINEVERHAFVASVDTPTGLDPSTGEVHGISVRPALTVSFHKLKAGLRDPRLTGRVIVVDIGIPLEAELFTGPGDVRRVTGARRPSSSKRDFGYVLVVGGSDVYSGAPALTALAALRTGAGLTIVAAPEKACETIRSFAPDLIAHPLPGRFLETKHVTYISERILGRVNSVVIGPGLGDHDESGRAVRRLLQAVKKSELPAVIDADAIRAFSGKLGLLKGSRAVLTPNAGEFEAVTGLKLGDGEDWGERVDPAVDLAKKAGGCTILLKGHHTLITDGGRLKVNKTGNPSMAVGGSGDVLSGILGAYLAQGNDPFWAAAAGAFAHGRAGDLAYGERGYHVLASDLIEKLPTVLKPFDRTAR
jgi:ADP-dependent NAD(P)H-hydrate dehydratase / NAD(P)H-hydrate epimerase